MEVCIDGYGQKSYYLGGKTFTESEMFNIYNDYCDNEELYNELIRFNDEDFLNIFNSRLELVQEISHNSDYDINDEYVTYVGGVYLMSGRLEDCMNDDYLEEIEKQLEDDDDE